jgi:hypothetical protein
MAIRPEPAQWEPPTFGFVSEAYFACYSPGEKRIEPFTINELESRDVDL